MQTSNDHLLKSIFSLGEDYRRFPSLGYSRRGVSDNSRPFSLYLGLCGSSLYLETMPRKGER